jgi:polyisoprenoid-binding protein YceI
MKQVNLKVMMTSLSLILVLFVSSFAGSATKWNVEKANSSVNFKIWHLMTPVTGKFEDFDIDLNFDPENLDNSQVSVTIRTTSINTGWGPRDKHLRTEDWFNTDDYPVMTFKSSKIISQGDGDYIAEGTFKLRDVEKDIKLPFKLLGIHQIPEDMQNVFDGSDEVASFEISNFIINRKDFHVGTGTSTPGEAAMTYRDVVGNSVNINIAIEVKRKIIE